MAPTVLRGLARALLRCATSESPVSSCNRAVPPEVQLNHIGSDVEALTWAIGRIWSARVECMIARIHPAVNCVLLLVGLYFAVHVLIVHLAWYGVPQQQLEFPDESLRGLAKLGMFVFAIALVALTTSGCPRRRIFSAAIFPFLCLLGLLATASAFKVAASIAPPGEYPVVEAILRALIIGWIVASALCIPATLLYRATAAPIAFLSLLPSVARVVWNSTPNLDAVGMFSFGWPFICAFILIAVSTHICRRWLRLLSPQ